MTASALVFIMIPSLSLIYAGISNRSFAMTMVQLPMLTAAVVGLQVREPALPDTLHTCAEVALTA
jgi:ammonia channel protein AmtB